MLQKQCEHFMRYRIFRLFPGLNRKQAATYPSGLSNGVLSQLSNRCKLSLADLSPDVAIVDRASAGAATSNEYAGITIDAMFLHSTNHYESRTLRLA